MTIGDFSPQDFNHGLWQSPEAPVTFINGFPSRSGKPPTSTQLDSLCGNQGCSSPQIHHPFQRKTSQPSSHAIHGGYQQIIQGLPPPGSAGGGLLFSLQYQSMGNSKRLIIIQSVVKA
ncbi:hypothetical protein O181_005214 [Austropuccinia psidii MF-1]|uniref:Uncharacterized protein n=1 Tax=Austropuccinia psidii MF-1 TaxID=1389203 RepID=A0A9Q3BHP2_9BASI|nr:hypothetical protein [Austropuccinia psidii MF-1]